MDFSDEPYVRKYTRKTVTNRLLRWEGRAVLDAMLGEFDAAGIFAIRGDAAECISAVTEIPIEIVRIGLARIIETETWVVTQRTITWPTYEEAQNCVCIYTRALLSFQREVRRAARTARPIALSDACAYCGARPERMTIDHVIPLCQGGNNEPRNLVPACVSCNSRKGGRTPEQAGMRLLEGHS